MTIDVGLIRPEGNKELVEESQRRRFKGPETVEAVVQADAELRKANYNLSQANTAKNKHNTDIQSLRKEGKVEESKELVKKRDELEVDIGKYKEDVIAATKALDAVLKPIGNIVHSSVPVSKNEDDNVTVRTWGACEKRDNIYHHHELLAMIDGYDPERGVGVAGHRAYFLKGWGVRLNQALINYALDFLYKREYTALQTPFFMKKEVMARTAQLEQFDEELYKLVAKGSSKMNGENGLKLETDEMEDKYLIATSEQPISAFHQNEWLEPSQLPLRYAGYSTCFRKEAGAHGKDTWGIFRVHQFEKVEQFVLTTPETSWDMHEAMLANSEHFFQSLNIPYRVVSIVSGALNNAAAKKYDLEGWFPAFAEFRELVSCSNCTDYQSRELEIRCGTRKQGEREKRYVHMLNSTLVATTRGICALLENGQCPEGIRVPEPLRPYLGGTEIIPFSKPCPPKPKELKGKEVKETKPKEPKPKQTKPTDAPAPAPAAAEQQ